uniref:Adenosine kinase 2 n=1 Tax=Riptortus pedestris TaxID=329032 RepID=R4WQ08_RIPPE|nr:adenosine kinase 2 [Riptortus pedestris]
MSNEGEAKCLRDTDTFVSSLCSQEHSSSTDDSLFYFETDFLPLKGNTDYLKLMKTLAILEVQRIKVSRDIQELEELKIQSQDEPFKVKQKILEGKLPCLSRCKIEKVPEIDFSKYRSLNTGNKKNVPARRKTTRTQTLSKDEDEQNNGHEIRVRGRVYNEKKPQTFNQLWTVEEQLRLEQLLIEIPPEPVEYRRWEKIADALGSRTAQQVCSRVQKYFKKLAKAGIGPSGANRRTGYKKRAQYVHKQHKHYLYRPSTFFPGASMGELEETDSEEESNSDSNTDLAHWAEIHKKIKEERENEELKVEHIGYKCQNCGKEPITGLRWECKSCPTISFCSDCMSQLCKMNPPPHPVTHQFRFFDLFNNTSYNIDAFSCDNYLDPNAHVV